jgi:AmiR/NasT family two-component response regulator
MKILILNENLRSGMQMYLALSNHCEVEIAQDTDDLLKLVAKDNPDYTFLDLCPEDSVPTKDERVALANQIIKNHPQMRIVGICDKSDKSLQKQATQSGISAIITRPIKNRELLKIISG